MSDLNQRVANLSPEKRRILENAFDGRECSRR